MFSEDLSKGRFIEIVSKNYNEKTGKKVKLYDEMPITFGLIGAIADFKLYYNGVSGNKCYLSDGEIDDALNNYASSRGLVLDSFSYLGGIKRTGIYAGESTPYFFGVRLNLDEKELEVGDYLVKEREFNA